MHRPVRRRLLAAIAASSLVVAACGGDDDSADEPTGEPAASATAEEPAEEPADEPAEEPADEPAEEPAEEMSEEPADEMSEEMSADEPAEEAGADIYPLTISDSYGNEFTFDEAPRLGCAWYGCVEAGAELGINFAASIIGEDEVDSAFYGATSPEFLISDFLNPEEWAATDVDLVLISPASNSPDIEPVASVVDMFYLHYDNFLEAQWDGVLGGYDAYIENIRLIGQLTGTTDRAEAAIANFDAMVENLAQYSTPETEQQSIAVIGLLGYASLSSGAALCQVFNEAGHGTCIGEGGVAAILNAEAFLALDPDVIIDVDPDSRDGDPIWPNLSAVQNGKVYNFDTSRYYCCSTGGLILAAQEYIARAFPDSGVPLPGPDADFIPSESPLVTG